MKAAVPLVNVLLYKKPEEFVLSTYLAIAFTVVLFQRSEFIPLHQIFFSNFFSYCIRKTVIAFVRMCKDVLFLF